MVHTYRCTTHGMTCHVDLEARKATFDVYRGPTSHRCTLPVRYHRAWGLPGEGDDPDRPVGKHGRDCNIVRDGPPLPPRPAPHGGGGRP